MPTRILELTIQRSVANEYILNAVLDEQDTTRPLSNISVKFDYDRLRSHTLSPLEYGRSLCDQLFADLCLRAMWVHAAGAPLQIHLHLVEDDKELHGIRWETLCHPMDNRPLALQEGFSFVRFPSMYDPSLSITRSPRPNMKALLVVANPSNLSVYSLSEIAVHDEVEHIRRALDNIELTILGDATKRATLKNIAEALHDGPTILILIAHGKMQNGEPWLYLEDDIGCVKCVSGMEFAETIKNVLPHPLLTILASCYSADGPATALGSLLVQRGIAAVIGFQGTVMMGTVRTFLPTLITELRRDGQIDRALTAARQTVKHQQTIVTGEWWSAVLFSHLRDGQIWNERPDFERLRSNLSRCLTKASEGEVVKLAERISACPCYSAYHGEIIQQLSNGFEHMMETLYAYDRGKTEFISLEREIRLIPDAIAGSVPWSALFDLRDILKRIAGIDEEVRCLYYRDKNPTLNLGENGVAMQWSVIKALSDKRLESLVQFVQQLAGKSKLAAGQSALRGWLCNLAEVLGKPRQGFDQVRGEDNRVNTPPRLLLIIQPSSKGKWWTAKVKLKQDDQQWNDRGALNGKNLEKDFATQVEPLLKKLYQQISSNSPRLQIEVALPDRWLFAAIDQQPIDGHGEREPIGCLHPFIIRSSRRLLGNVADYYHIHQAWGDRWSNRHCGEPLLLNTLSACTDTDIGRSLLDNTLSCIIGTVAVDERQFFASEPAWELAKALAVAPLSPPIIRLVQQTIEEKPRTEHLAEVVLGGLFHRKPGRSGDMRTNEVQFEIEPAVREELIQQVPLATKLSLLQRIAHYTGRYTGPMLSFRLLLGNLRADMPDARNENAEFVEIAALVLKDLGGSYQELATQMRGKEPVPAPPTPPEPPAPLPPAPTEYLSQLESTGKREPQLMRLREQLIVALESAKEDRFALYLDINLANTELRTFIAQLALGVRRIALIIVGDVLFKELHLNCTVIVPPLTVDDVRLWVRKQHLPLTDATIAHLHQLSFGRPALLERIVHTATRDAKRSGTTLDVALHAINPSRDLEAFAYNEFRRLPEPFQRLLELDALITEHTPEARKDIVAIFSALYQATRHAFATELPVLHERYMLHLRTSDMAKVLQRPALASLRTRPEFPVICLFIADVYEKRSVLQPAQVYLTACYAALAGEYDRAAAELVVNLTDNAPAIYGPWCLSVYTTTKTLLTQYHGRYQADLHEIAGNCAAYLGQYQAAIDHYATVLDLLPPAGVRAQRISLQLLKIYHAVGDKTHTRRLSQQFTTALPPTNPVYGLALAYQGILLIDTDQQQACSVLQYAIALLETTRAQWDDPPFYTAELARLYDYLARAEIWRGHYALAIEHLQQAQQMARELGDDLLMAMLENNLGIAHFYRGQATDFATARHALQRAYATRKRMGDLVGQMRSVLNLIVFNFRLAQSAQEWAAVETLYTEVDALAHRVEAADRTIYMVNHLTAHTLQGAFAEAHRLVDAVMRTPPAHDDTHILLLLNRANLALAERDAATCQHYLAAAYAIIGGGEHIINHLEWITTTLESHILLGVPFDLALVQKALATSTVDDSEQPVNAAAWLSAQGLLAFIEGEPTRAIELLSRSQELWAGVQFYYHQANTSLWRTYILCQLGDRERARISAQETEALLVPFGATPALTHLRELQRTLG